jgi:hypothetical protein
MLCYIPLSTAVVVPSPCHPSVTPSAYSCTDNATTVFTTCYVSERKHTVVDGHSSHSALPPTAFRAQCPLTLCALQVDGLLGDRRYDLLNAARASPSKPWFGLGKPDCLNPDTMCVL